jgi:hypothetical protein
MDGGNARGLSGKILAYIHVGRPIITPAYSALLTPMDGGNARGLSGTILAYIHVGRMSVALSDNI